MSDVVPSPSPQGPTPERRASIRQRFDWDVTCELSSYGVSERWSAQVRDISSDGLGLVIDRPFDVGTILEIELMSRDGSIGYTIVARVTRSEALGDGRVLAGCQFVGRVADEELRDLL